MLNSLKSGAAMLLAATTITAAQAETNPFNKIRKAKEKVERAVGATEAASTAGNSSAAGTSGGAASSGKRAGPAPEKFTAMTKCAALPMTNVMIGQVGDYTFQSGIKTEERSGFINRENVSPTNGCILPSMGTYDFLYVEVDAAKYEAMGNSNDWELQCAPMHDGIKHVDMKPSMGNLSGKDMMLHTGHSLGYTPSAAGSNSDRSRAWDDELKKRGKAMISVNMPPLHNGGPKDDFYCQYYNKPSGTSAFAFAYRRHKG